MKRVRTFDETRTRDERESCFPAMSGKDGSSIGVVLSVPITAAVASVLYGKK